MADLEARFQELHQNMEQQAQNFHQRLNDVVNDFTERIQSEDDNIHQFEMRLNTTLEERLQEYSAQINKSFQTISQQYTPITMHEEVDRAVANCVPIQNFNDLQSHVKKLQIRITDLDDAFSENHHEMVQFQAQLVAKIEEIVVQCDEINITAAKEREKEKAERMQQIEELRKEMCNLHEEKTRERDDLFAKEGKARQDALELESATRARDDQELNEALRKLINESVNRECDKRNTQINELTEMLSEEAADQNTRIAGLTGSHKELSKLLSDGFQSQSKNLESEHEAWKHAVQELDAMLRTLINESVNHESNERGMQLQEMVRKLQELLNTEEDERNKQFQELVSLLRDLDASHTELQGKHSDGHNLHTDNHSQLEQRLNELELSHSNLSSRHLDGHQMHSDNHSSLEQRLGELEASHSDLHSKHVDGHQRHSENLEAERRQRAQELENHGELLRQIEKLLGQENTERNAQIQDLLRRLNSNQDANRDALEMERKAKDEQFASFRNAMQNLARETAEERQVRGNAIEGLSKGSEGLKQELGSKLANLKEELSGEDERTRQQLGQLAAITREQMTQMCEGAKAESAKKVAILQGSINGLQTAVEQDRMAFREAREEQMRNMQSEREARNRQNAETRADYKREILKEHQDRLDDAAEARKDIFNTMRGGKKTGQGATYDPSLTAVDGPDLGSGQGSERGTGPQFGTLEGLSDLDKKHSITSLGQRLSLMGSISPKPTFRSLQPAQ